MRRLLFSLTFLALSFGLCAQIKISQYPNTNQLGPNQLFIVTAGATNMNVKTSDMPGALGVPTLATLYSVGANTTNFAKGITNNNMWVNGSLTIPPGQDLIAQDRFLLSGDFVDANSSAGTPGQVLTSTGSSANWSNAPTSFDTLYVGTLTVTNPIPYWISSNGVRYSVTNVNFVGNTKMTNVNGTMSVDVTPGAGSGEVNVNGEVSVTNATTVGLVYGKSDVTNLLRSIRAGANVTLTNEGTNVVIASSGSGSSPTTTQGDIIRRGASVDERLGIGPIASRLWSDGVNPFWADEFSGMFVADSFSTGGSLYGASIPSTGLSGGIAAYVSFDPYKPERKGLLQIGRATTNAASLGWCRYSAATSATNFIIGTNTIFETVMGLQETVIIDTNSGPAVSIWTNFTMCVGFGTSAAGESSQIAGAGFGLSWNGANTTSNVYTWVKRASSRTTNVTAVILTTNIWYKLRISGSTNSLVFSINDVTVSTHTDAENMPIGVPLVPILHCQGTVSTEGLYTNQHKLNFDYVKIIER